MKSQKPFAQAHQRLLTTLDPNAGWLLLQLQLATCYPHRHAANGASIKLSYDEMASLARISKASVRGLLERLVSGGWIKFEEGGGRAKSTIRCLLQPEHQLNCTVQPQASTNSLTLNINNLPAGSVASSNNPVVYQMVAARSAAAIPLPKPPVQASPPEPNATAALEEQKNKNQNNNDGRGRGADTPISILPEPTPTPAYIPPSSTPPTRRDQLLGWLTTYYRCPPIPELVRWAEELLSWADEPTVTYLQAVAERGRVENGGRPVKIRWLEITASNLKQSGVRREEHTRDRTSPKPAAPGKYATAYATAASFADPAPADPAPLPTTLPTVPAPDLTAARAGWELATWPFERGILSGYAGGIFRPAAYTTRGEFAKIAVNAFGVPAYTPTSGQSFSDVPRSHPFFRYVEAAARANVIQGLGNSSFGINRNITRADATLIVVHTRGYALLNPTIPTFSDVPRDFYAYQAIETLAARGIINGSSGGGGFIFRPADPITRGELAKVTRRAIESPP